jgi:hypothetical protein
MLPHLLLDHLGHLALLRPAVHPFGLFVAVPARDLQGGARLAGGARLVAFFAA